MFRTNFNFNKCINNLILQKMKTININGKKITLKNVVCERVIEGASDSKDVALVSQEAVTTYSATRFDTGFGSGLIDNEEGQSFTSKRYALVDIKKGMTIDEVQSLLDKNPEGCIWRIKTNNINDVISDRNKYAIAEGFKTIEDYKKSFEVQDSEGNVYAQGKENNDHTLPAEYKRDVYSPIYHEDEDKRIYVGEVEKEITNAIPKTEFEG